MNAFEERLARSATEREARIRAEADPRIPRVPSWLDGDEDGFVTVSEAAQRMGCSTAEVLRLIGAGALTTRGRGAGLRVRPAIVSGSSAVRASTALEPARGPELEPTVEEGGARPRVHLLHDA